MSRENTMRGARPKKTHCPSGHRYDEANTYWRLDRYGRECRACDQTRKKQVVA